MSQDSFIKEHLAQYGLNGFNTNHNRPRIGFPEYPCANTLQFSHRNHFLFGYNGLTFNWRKSSSCIYWTDYGRPERAPMAFFAEAVRSFQLIYERHGKFSLAYMGDLNSQFMLEAAARSGCPHEVVVMQIPGYLEIPLPKSAARSCVVEISRIEKFIFDFAEEVRCDSPLVGLRAFFALLSDLPTVFHAKFDTLVNCGFDRQAQKMAGPTQWALVDNERATAIERWLIRHDRPGVGSFFKFSPELMSAFFNDPVFAQWLRKSRAQATSEPCVQVILQRALPNFRCVNDLQTVFLARTASLQIELAKCYDKCGENWLSPLSRLAEKFAFAYEFSDEDIYGAVFSHR